MADKMLQGMYVDLATAFTDQGSGAKGNLTSASPSSIPDGWYWYGQRGFGSYIDPGDAERYLLIRPHSDWSGSNPLKQPDGFIPVWGMYGHGINMSGSRGLWTPYFNVPSNYQPVADIFTLNSEPEVGHYRCVSPDCLIPVDVGYCMWNDQGSGAQEDGSVWTVTENPLAIWSLIRAQRGYDKPNGPYYTLNMDVVEIIQS